MLRRLAGILNGRSYTITIAVRPEDCRAVIGLDNGHVYSTRGSDGPDAVHALIVILREAEEVDHG